MEKQKMQNDQIKILEEIDKRTFFAWARHHLTPNKNYYNRWSDEHVEKLIKLYSSIGAKKLVPILNRREEYINRKANDLGLKISFEEGYKLHKFNGYMDVPGLYVGSIRNAAKKRGFEFRITAEIIYKLLIKQNCRCFYSNQPISFLNKTASVDRIDSSVDYLENNIQLVHKNVNAIKMLMR